MRARTRDTTPATWSPASSGASSRTSDTRSASPSARSVTAASTRRWTRASRGTTTPLSCSRCTGQRLGEGPGEPRRPACPRRPARATAGSRTTSASTGAWTTCWMSAVVSARPGSCTTTTPDGRNGACIARRRAMKHGRITSSDRRAAPATATEAAAGPRSSMRPQSTTVGRAAPSSSPASSPARWARSSPSPRGSRVTPGVTVTSSRASASAGTDSPAASHALSPGESGSGRPSAAGRSPARSASRAPDGALCARSSASEAETTVVPAPPLTDQQATSIGNLHRRGRGRQGREGRPCPGGDAVDQKWMTCAEQ